MMNLQKNANVASCLTHPLYYMSMLCLQLSALPQVASKSVNTALTHYLVLYHDINIYSITYCNAITSHLFFTLQCPGT